VSQPGEVGGGAFRPGPAAERGASARADRRVVTVLFADLSGFTVLGNVWILRS
jgi:class 3 adenylate cyclase